MRQSLAVITALVLVISAGPALAQRSPLLPDGVYGALVNEISGDIAFEHIRWLTHYHRPMGGSEGFEAVAKYVEQKAREYGLEDVRYIPLKYSSNSWSAPPEGQYDDRLPRVFGILLAAALLSLGAPFWYAVLANLLKLRSVIAGKDEAQRTERQTTQEVGPLTRPIEMTPAPPLPPASPAPPDVVEAEG